MAEEHHLLFSEEEWEDVCSDVTSRMESFVSQSITPISKHCGDYAELVGTGSYLALLDQTFILTNEHVASVSAQDGSLLHLPLGFEEFQAIPEERLTFAYPLDTAVLPVQNSNWKNGLHNSKLITLDMMALAHDHVPGELLAFLGFSGERSQFSFNTLVNRWTCSVAREVTLPEDTRFNSRFHFGIDYRPDLATSTNKSYGLPQPAGFSGSSVWDTGFVKARMQRKDWSPDDARLTGLVWGWPSSKACIVATRIEYVRSFLLAAIEKMRI